MNKYVEAILEKHECPIINSLMFFNGDMLVLKSYFIGGEHRIEILCKSTIKSFFDYNKENAVSSFSVPVCAENESFRIFAGEGSWGGDGIVYVIDKVKNKLFWFLFLENSDPFEEIEFEASDVIIIRSSSDIRLKIPVKTPHEIESIQRN